jgi:hypothetical protein
MVLLGNAWKRYGNKKHPAARQDRHATGRRKKLQETGWKRSFQFT